MNTVVAMREDGGGFNGRQGHHRVDLRVAEWVPAAHHPRRTAPILAILVAQICLLVLRASIPSVASGACHSG